MPLLLPGGLGGGGVLGLGPVQNTFGDAATANRAAAEALRDTYATANAEWLAQYDGNLSLWIRLVWTASAVEQRRTSAGTGWEDVTNVIRGQTGEAGNQARFIVYAYINAATAPTAAPTGGTFVQSTGVLTVPATYAAAPSTPAALSTTYRTEAAVNPRVDDDSVALTWSVPAELPAYEVVAMAEAAQAAAEMARDLAEQYAGQAQDVPVGSPRGDLIATSPTLSTTSITNSNVRTFATAELWTIDSGAPSGYSAGDATNNERLYLPSLHPAGVIGLWAVIEVSGVEIGEGFIPFGGGAGYTPTSGNTATWLPASLTVARTVQIRGVPRSAATAQYIQIYGAGTTLPAATVVKLYTVVVRGEEGPGGGGGGGGTNQTNLSIGGRGVDTLDIESDTGTDATVPAATTVASGLMTAADKGKLDAIEASATADQTNAQIKAAYETNADTEAFTTAEKAKLAGIAAGAAAYSGETLFGAVDPVAADGNDKDIRINTTDGTVWKKAASAWTEQYTFPSGAVDPGDHTRRAAISEDETLEQAEYDAGTTSMDQDIAIPTWTGNNRYVFLGIPEAEDDMTDIQQAGFSVFGNWERVAGVSFVHKWWRTSDAQSVLASGLTYTIVQ